MQMSVLRVLTESGEANISYDEDEKGVDSAELLGIDYVNLVSVQLKMVRLMHIIPLECGSKLFYSNSFYDA